MDKDCSKTPHLLSKSAKLKVPQSVFCGQVFPLINGVLEIKNGKILLPLVVVKNKDKPEVGSPFRVEVSLPVVRKVVIIDEHASPHGATALAIFFQHKKLAQIVQAINKITSSNFQIFVDNAYFAFQVDQNWKLEKSEIMNFLSVLKEASSVKFSFIDYVNEEEFDKLLLMGARHLVPVDIPETNGLKNYEFKQCAVPASLFVARSDMEKVALKRPKKVPTSSKFKVEEKYEILEFSRQFLYDFYNLGFANDTLIDYGILRLLRNFPKELKDHICVMPSHFFGRLISKIKCNTPLSEVDDLITASYINCQNSITNNMFEKNIIFMPTCRDSHWFLTIILNPSAPYSGNVSMASKCKIIIMDSLLPEPIEGDEVHAELCTWVSSFLKLHYTRRQSLNFLPYGMYNRALVEKVVPLNFQQQLNGSDCGLFVLFYMEQFLNKLPNLSSQFLMHDWEFPEFNANALRQDLIIDILQQSKITLSSFLDAAESLTKAQHKPIKILVPIDKTVSSSINKPDEDSATSKLVRKKRKKPDVIRVSDRRRRRNRLYPSAGLDNVNFMQTMGLEYETQDSDVDTDDSP